MTNTITESESGNEIDFVFSGDFDDLNEAQNRFHAKLEQNECFNYTCNCNALKELHSLIEMKYGNSSISACDVLRIIRDNGYLGDDFLSDVFHLSVNDVKRALDHGVIPPSVIKTLAKFFAIKQ